MLRRAGPRVLVAGAALLSSRVSPALAAGCSTDVFAIDGNAVNVELCSTRAPLAAAHGKAVPAQGGDAVRETITVKGRPPLVREVRYQSATGDATARSLDDIPLAALGIGKTMHVTLAVHDGNVRLEHALLVPGATPLK